jgi:S1-C subfamily serine protease
MKNFFFGVLRFLGAVLPFVIGAFLFLALFATQKLIIQKQNDILAQVQEAELNQATQYDAILEVDLALAQADIQVAKNLDKIKLDAAKQNADLLKTVYVVDKNAQAREQGIVNGVNGLVKDVSYALQKPSYEYLKNITVRIIAKAVDADLQPAGKKGWMGTGVIVAVDKDFTYILTNRHVVDKFGDGTHNYYVREDVDTKYPLELLKVSENEKVDLALVRVKGHIDGKVAVIGFGEAKPQDPVYLVGQNLGRHNFYSEGTVSGYDEDSNDELVIGAPIGPGNSGSGIINKDGKLVGLLYAGSIIQEDEIEEMDIAHGLCVPIKAIRLFLAGYIE